MKAIRIAAFGGPDQVRVEDLPRPGLEPGEALVRVRAAGVNPVDWMIREHVYNPKGADRVPMTLGQDFAGIVEELAPPLAQSPASETIEPGTEVFGETWGAFAELISVPARDLARKPASLDFLTAAAIPMPGLTAWQVVVETAQVRPGQRFLVHGASGGVGSFAAQFARIHGADVTVTAGPESVQFLKSVGIDDVIDYHRERFEARGRYFDVVIDPIGGEVQRRSFEVLKPGGMLIDLVGEIDEEAAARAAVRGVPFGMRYEPEHLRRIAALIEQGAVKAHISKVMRLEEARKALDLNQNGQSHGKIVLKVA